MGKFGLINTTPKVSGRLSKSSIINLPVAVDNIEFDDQSGEIIVGQYSYTEFCLKLNDKCIFHVVFMQFEGTIPDLKSAMKKIEVPGGMAVLRYTKWL